MIGNVFKGVVTPLVLFGFRKSKNIWHRVFELEDNQYPELNVSLDTNWLYLGHENVQNF